MEINKWEYKQVREYDIEHGESESLSELGKKGWEMVGLSTTGTGSCFHYIFKRPCGKITMREVEKKTDRGYDGY